MEKIKNFLHDADGLSAKDFLMLVFVSTYLIMMITCFFLAVFGKLPEGVMDVAMSMDAVIITIVGGVFSVQVVQEFRKPKEQPQTYDYNNDDNYPVG